MKRRQEINVFSTSAAPREKVVTITPDGQTALPLQQNAPGDSREALLVENADSCLLIPRTVDVRKLYIEPTTICNFNCTTCIRHSWADDLAHMDWSVFVRIYEGLDRLPQLECVHFGGFGEPFSHPRLLEMLALVKDKGLQAEVITNGSLLSDEVIERLIDMQLDRLFVSLDGPEEEYNQIRQGGDFAAVVKNIRALNRAKEKRASRFPELGIEFVATRDNYQKLPALSELTRQLKARRVIVTNLLPYHREMKDQILYDVEDITDLFSLEEAFNMRRLRFPEMRLRTDRMCKFVRDNAMAINYRGRVAPCYALMHSYHCYVYGREKEIFAYHPGRVDEKALDEIWIEPNYLRFRHNVRNFAFPSCPDCKFLDGCTYACDNEADCWGNSPSCADCLWSRQLVLCP